jgi:hypothetical protein
MTFFSKHISVTIQRKAESVYLFVVNPENLPKWASGLGSSVRKINKEWIMDSPMGEIKIRFADYNNYGVLDHFVTLPDETEVYNPMRVFANGEGCEVVFSLYKLNSMTSKQFEDDALHVEADLQKLKTILETQNAMLV